MRLAYFTPLPPSKSGIADYNSELLPYLAKGAEISVFVAEGDELRENRDRADFSVHEANDFDEICERRPFDLCVYHQGNNPHHEYVYDRAIRTPGLLVMHESCLHHLVAWKTLARKDLDAYRDEMFYAYGRKGARAAEMRAHGMGSEYQQFLMPLNRRVALGSLGIIVHNAYAASNLEGVAGDIPVKVIPHHLSPKTYELDGMDRIECRRSLGIPDVLIVDEALSVGDVYFQRKSLDRMEYFRKAGKTVLFVSHEPVLVQRFCTRALWLEQGRVAMVGDAKEVVTSYQAFCARLEEERLRDLAGRGGIASREHDDILRELKLTGSRWGNVRIKFTGAEMINSRGEQAWIFKTGEDVTIRLRIEADDDYPEPVFAIDVHRFDGVFVGIANNIDTHPTTLPVKKGVNLIELRLNRLELPYNAYFLSLKAYTKNEGPDWKDPAGIHNQMYQFDVVTDRLIHGLMRFDAEWRGDTINEPKQESVALP